jgi:hypothetical protein
MQNTASIATVLFLLDVVACQTTAASLQLLTKPSGDAVGKVPENAIA